MRIEFDNSFLRDLPGDAEAGPRVREVFAAWSRVDPTPVAAPRLLAWSPEAAALVGLDAADAGHSDFARVFGGNALLHGMQPWAANYGGHQFGSWAGQLGDGRAISLGEAIGPDGGRRELQLKGAGRTPYSRFGDGRAVLRSSIREFLCSEAMHHLGIPTTRALSLVGTGEEVVRDMFYDGHPRPEPGAVVCRMAPGFLRFGSWQLRPRAATPSCCGGWPTTCSATTSRSCTAGGRMATPSGSRGCASAPRGWWPAGCGWASSTG